MRRGCVKNSSLPFHHIFLFNALYAYSCRHPQTHRGLFSKVGYSLSAHQIRAKRLELSPNLAYRLFFVVPAQPEKSTAPDASYLAPYKKLALLIQEELHSSIQYELFTLAHPKLLPSITAFKGTWLVIGLGWPCGHRDLEAQVASLRAAAPDQEC